MHRLLPIDKAVITKDPIYYEDLKNGVFYACQANGQVDMAKWDILSQYLQCFSHLIFVLH